MHSMHSRTWYRESHMCNVRPQLRKGYNDGADIAHELLPKLAQWGAAAATVQVATRQQR